MSRPLCLRAWLLAEGNVLPGGAVVISIRRNPVTYQVAVSTDDGSQWTLPGDVHVAVTHRAR